MHLVALIILVLVASKTDVTTLSYEGRKFYNNFARVTIVIHWMNKLLSLPCAPLGPADLHVYVYTYIHIYIYTYIHHQLIRGKFAVCIELEHCW